MKRISEREREAWMLITSLLILAVAVLVATRSQAETKPVVDYVRVWKVTEVESNYGLQQGDLIVSVNGRQCRSADELRDALPGVVRVFRGEKPQEFIIEVPAADLGARAQPVGIFMRREAAPQ